MANKNNILINGFGRIGKALFHQLINQLEFFGNLTINAGCDLDALIHQIKYDSIHGIFPDEIIKNDNALICRGKKIKCTNYRTIEQIELEDIDLVFECTGHYKERSDFEKFITQGAKKLIISAPCEDADRTIIFGVNHEQIKPSDRIISAGSCTTNCLAPICDVLVGSIGITKGFMTTIHSYTNDQRLLDGNHKDPRRSRSASLSIIPSTTGAAKTIGQIIPMLKGKIDGSAIRVPTPNVSMIDFTFIAAQNTTIESVNAIFQTAAITGYMRIIEVAKDPLVSVDFNGNMHSAIFDPFETRVIDGNFVRLVAWYDNETAFAARMLDIARVII